MSRCLPASAHSHTGCTCSCPCIVKNIGQTGAISARYKVKSCAQISPPSLQMLKQLPPGLSYSCQACVPVAPPSLAQSTGTYRQRSQGGKPIQSPCRGTST